MPNAAICLYCAESHEFGRMNLPNALTVARIVAVPLLIAVFYLPYPAANWVALAVFVAASVTDWLDGYLARRWNQGSDFGKVLDPIADKLLVAAALFMLAAFGRLSIASIVAEAPRANGS